MSDHSIFELWDHPEGSSLERVEKNNMTTLFATGIVNPFGPTLTAITIDGEIAPGVKLPIVRLMLNPFRQECQVVGRVTIGGIWNPLKDLPQFFPLLFGSCPTVLLPSSYINEELLVGLYAALLTGFADGFEVLAKAKKFAGDPWGRISEDMKSLPSVIERLHSRGDVEERTGNLEESEAIELAGLLLEPYNLKAEIQAFLFAWQGSIEHQSNATRLHENILDFQDFLHLFAALALSCRLPDLSQ